MIFDNMAGYIFDNLFGLSACDSPYNDTGGGVAALGFICLLSTVDESFYTENWTGTASPNIHSVSDSVDNTYGAKRFIEDSLGNYDIWFDGDREEISFKDSFLYSSEECISSSIESIGIFFSANADATTGGHDIARIGRVKNKDGGGIPITSEKISGQVVLVDYVFSLVTF